MYGCNGCEKTWNSTTNAHCSECHVTFRNITGFDKHRILDGICLDPLLNMQMIEVDGIWASMDSHRQRIALRTRVDRARASRHAPDRG